MGHSAKIEKKLCSTNYVVTAFYEFPKSDLFKTAENLKKQNKSFSGADLEQAVKESLKDLNAKHQKGEIHGNIQPMFIGLTKDNNFKLLKDLQNEEDFQRVQLNNLSDDKELFMSPELYYKLEGKHKE